MKFCATLSVEEATK